MQTAPFLASLSPWKSQSLFLCSFLLPFPSSLYLCPSPLSAWSDSFMFILYSVFELFGDLGSINCCSVTKSCPTLHDPMDCSTPGFPALHYLLEFAQVHVHWISDAIQPSHPLSSPSSPAFRLSHHQSLFQWVGSSHQVAKVLEFQFLHQSFHEYSALISFRIDWFDLLAVQGTLKSLLQHCSSRASVLWHSAFFMVQLSHSYTTNRKKPQLWLHGPL